MNAVTTQASSLGFNTEALERLSARIRADIDAQRYDGARVLVARRGQIAFDLTYGWADRQAQRPLTPDAVFSIMSISKVMTAIALLRCVERGRVSLLTPVAEVIPEFAKRGKALVTVGQVITHTAGLGMAQPPMPIDQLIRLEKSVAVICDLPLETSPGDLVSYSAMTGFTILGEIIRRLDPQGRPLRKIMDDEVFAPLGMTDTAFGMRSRFDGRRVPVVVRDPDAPELNRKFLADRDNAADEATELPSGGGTFSTATDILRMAEALRRDGELNGYQLLSPAMMAQMRANQTGLKPNSMMNSSRALHGMAPFPAFLGLGLFLRGEGFFPSHIASLASPGSFGGWGLGSTAFWVDPEREISFVALTGGLMERIRSLLRFQAIGDMALAALHKP